MSFMDGFSHKFFILKNKVKYLSKFKEFKAFVEEQIGERIKALRIDNGGEFKSREFQKN